MPGTQSGSESPLHTVRASLPSGKLTARGVRRIGLGSSLITISAFGSRTGARQHGKTASSPDHVNDARTAGAIVRPAVACKALAVQDADLYAALTPVVAEMLDRHLTRAQPWLPHEMVPWSRGADYGEGSSWSETDCPLPAAVRSALYVNLLTEDNLPYYVVALDRHLGGIHGPWGEWIRRWTAEEDRHSSVLRDWILVTRALDPAMLEHSRMAHMSRGWFAPQADLGEALVYLTMQELSTRIAHRNTGAALDDPAGEAILNRVAADENLHYLFYRDLAAAAFELDPDRMVRAAARWVRDFEMPGTGIPGFRRHALAVARAGIFDLQTFHDHVLCPLLFRHWRFDKRENLGPAAERAREETHAHLDRVARVGARLSETASARRVRA